MTPRTEMMAAVARQYCELIERTVDDPPPIGWLGNVASLLPRINAAVTALDDEASLGYRMQPDIDSRFELFSRLHELLGELDAYWLEFDALGDTDSRSGSLADDLTDIYCELKSGLKIMGVSEDHLGARQAAASWRQGYRTHWGRHILDAQRHLMDLSVLG